MINSWRASQGCLTLDRFGHVKKSRLSRVVRETSMLSNAETEKETQIMRMLELYRVNPAGLTDEEMKISLADYFGIYMPNSTVSARRNDINKNHVRFCDAHGLPSANLIVSSDRRPNLTGRSAMVWTLNKYNKEE